MKMQSISVYLLLFAAVLSGCSDTPVSSTEVGNPTIAGRILDLDGTIASNARVDLYPEGYDPLGEYVHPSEWSTITDNSGRYLFKNVVQGTYNIKAQRRYNNTITLIRNVEMPDEESAEINAPDGALEKPALLTVSLKELSMDRQGYIYFPGTGIYTEIDAV
jgi:protocatechuate 3,4-dioxygenase beta subunit